MASGLHEIRSPGAYRCNELKGSDLLSALSGAGLTCAVVISIVSAQLGSGD